MEDYHKTVILDIEITGLVPTMQVPGKRPGTTKKEQVPYETGYDQYPYIVSLAWKVDDHETKEYIINQEGRKIPQEAIDIHGITDEMVAQSEIKFFQAISEFAQDCVECEIIVGHGLYFNTSIIKANVLRVSATKGVDDPFFELISEILHKYKRIDTMTAGPVTKMMKKWPTLTELHMKLFNRGFDAHSAKEDVDANKRCYDWLLKKGMVPSWEKLQEKKAEKEAKEKVA